MEEENKTLAGDQQKLSYEKLKESVSELYATNQRLMRQINQMREALENRDFDYNSFFLSMLFKVIEHPNRYNEKFVRWCTANIEASLTSFAEVLDEMNKAKNQPQEPEKAEEHKEPTNEA